MCDLCGKHLTLCQKRDTFKHDYCRCNICEMRPCGNCIRTHIFYQENNKTTCGPYCDIDGLILSVDTINNKGSIGFWKARVRSLTMNNF